MGLDCGNSVSRGAASTRRMFLAGTAAAGLLALPGCASIGGYSLIDAVRRLLDLSSQRAFASLLQPDGFWDNQLARLALPDFLGSRGSIVQGILTSPLFKDRLQHAFNRVAERGAERAAPLVTDAVRTVGISNALAILEGGPSAATSFLRGAMATSLVEAMVPALGDAFRLSQEPLVGQLLGSLTGVDVTALSRDFAEDVDNAIWGEIGRQESAIRADPSSTNDPVLMAVLGTL